MDFIENDAGVFVPNRPTLLLGKEKIEFIGRYDWKHVRDGKIIDEGFDENLVVDEGLNYVLSVALAAGTQLPNWFLGVFEGNYTPVSTDTGATIAASATESSAYAAGVRQAWTPGAVASKTVSNSASRGDFVFNATKTIYGAILKSTSTIGDTAGKLFSAARFATAKSVVNLDELLLTYTFTASSV